MNIKEKLLKRIDELKPEILEVSRTIHANPELGYEEHKAAAFLCSRMQRHDFQVERPLKEFPTAFTATFKGKKPGPAIGLIAEFDALPEIGHGCGHNLISASGVGTALALVPVIEELGGSVTLFGTPAEESDGGKIPMIEAGLFDKVDVTMMMHPEGFYLVNTTVLALDALKFQFKGKASHAACTPHEGINALDAMMLLFNGVSALRQQLKPDVRIHGIITQGGTAPNIIPDFTEAKFYVRALDRQYLNGVTEKVKKVAEGAALSTGCSVEISLFERRMDNMINNPVLAEIVDHNLRELGIKDIALVDDVPGSTDYGNVSQVVPSIYFYCATAPKGSELHTAEFTELALQPMAHENLMVSIKAMALSALNLLERPELVQQARSLHRR